MTRILVRFPCYLSVESRWNPSGFLDTIPGLEPASMADLGQAVRRDPDALPARNALEITANWVYYRVKGIGGGNALFALKAGVLTSEIFCSWPESAKKIRVLT